MNGGPGRAAPAVTAADRDRLGGQLARFGAPEHVINRIAAQRGHDGTGNWDAWDGEVEVDDAGTPHLLIPEDLWPVVSLFLAMGTQWRSAGMVGARTGLDYGVMRPVARLSKVKLTPAVFADLQVMEAAALRELADIARREAEKADKRRG